MVALGYPGSEHHELLGPGVLVSQCGHGEVTDEPAGLIEHRGEGQAAGSRDPVGHETVEGRPGSRAGELVLGETGGLDHSHPFPHRGDLLGHHREGVGPVEGDLLERFLVGALEPQGVFEAVGGAPHGVGLGEPTVDGGGVQGPGVGELLVGEGDLEPAAVVLLDLGDRVGRGGPVAEAGHVHPPNVEAGVSGGHPVGHGQANAAPLAEAGHHPACHPVASLATNRADQRVAVGCEGEGSVDYLLDAHLGVDGEVGEPDFQGRGEAFQVGGQ